MRSFSVVLLLAIVALSAQVMAHKSNKGKGAHHVLLAQVNESISNLRMLAQMLNHINKNHQSEFGFGDVMNFGRKAIATGQNLYNKAMQVKERVMPIVEKVMPVAQTVMSHFAAQKGKAAAVAKKMKTKSMAQNAKAVAHKAASKMQKEKKAKGVAQKPAVAKKVAHAKKGKVVAQNAKAAVKKAVAHKKTASI